MWRGGQLEHVNVIIAYITGNCLRVFYRCIWQWLFPVTDLGRRRRLRPKSKVCYLAPYIYISSESSLVMDPWHLYQSQVYFLEEFHKEAHDESSWKPQSCWCWLHQQLRKWVSYHVCISTHQLFLMCIYTPVVPHSAWLNVLHQGVSNLSKINLQYWKGVWGGC